MQELGFKEAFQPLYALGEAEANSLTNIALRAGFAVLSVGIFYLLIAFAPDKGMSHQLPSSPDCRASSLFCFNEKCV